MVIFKDGIIIVIGLEIGRMVGLFKFFWEVFFFLVVIGNFLVVGCRDNSVYCFNVSEK